MKIGFITDSHLCNWRDFGDTGIQRGRISRRMQSQLNVLIQAFDIFEKSKVDYVCHLGDWTHSVGITKNEELNALVELLERQDFDWTYVHGNHDTAVRIKPDDHNIITNVIERFARSTGELEKELKIKIVNYYDEVDYDEIKGYDLVLLHKTPCGAKIGSFIFEDGVDWKRLADTNRLVLFGHIHQKQVLAKNCIILGSPMPFTFGDEGERGIWILDTEDFSIEFRKLKYPEFVTVENPDEVKEDGNYYRVLNCKEKINKQNVISVRKPEVFEERIKANTFDGIVGEWLKLNGKDDAYRESIKDLVTDKFQLERNIFKGKIKSVVVDNFGSVDRVAYKIVNGFIYVSGSSDTMDSNGSGKTSVFGEAPYWCLFDETTKGVSGDSVIRDTPELQPDCKVELVLADGDTEIKISRTRKKGLLVIRNGEELVGGLRQADRQKYLETLLGIDKTMFLASCYFSQKNLITLTGLGDAEKTGMITDLLGFEAYDDLYGGVTTKIKVKENELSALTQSEALRLENELKIIESSEKLMEKRIDELKDSLINVEERLITKKKSLNEQLREDKSPINVDEVRKEIDECLTTVASLEKEEETCQACIGEKEEGLNIVYSEQTKIANGLHAVKVERTSLDRAVEMLRMQIAKVSGAKIDGRCENCGAEITEANKQAFIKEKEEEIAKHRKSISDYEVQINAIEEALTQVKTAFTDLQKVIAEIKELKAKYRRDIEVFRRKKDNLTKALQEEELRSTKIEQIKKELSEQIAEYLKDIEGYEISIVDAVKEKKELQPKKEEIKIAIADITRKVASLAKDIEQLNFWKTAFSSKGIRGLLLDRFCNEINDFANKYLSIVSDGTMSMVMTPTKTLKSGEERNKIGLDIFVGDKLKSYIQLSGGEQKRCEISICLGLNRWIATRYNIPHGLFGIMVIDELFSHIDAGGADSIAQLLHEESANRSLIVIEHNAGLASYADLILRVVKENGVSRLEVG